MICPLFTPSYFQRSFVTSMLLLFSTFAHGQGFWSVDGHIAKVNMLYPQAKNPNMPITFYVDWDPSSRCAPTIGMIVLKNSSSLSMGKFQKSKESSENMVVTVGGRNWGSRTMISSYTNALDAMSRAPSDLMDALRNSTSAQFRPSKNTPTFNVPLEGAKLAIDEAKRNCN